MQMHSQSRPCCQGWTWSVFIHLVAIWWRGRPFHRGKVFQCLMWRHKGYDTLTSEKNSSTFRVFHLKLLWGFFLKGFDIAVDLNGCLSSATETEDKPGWMAERESAISILNVPWFLISCRETQTFSRISSKISNEKACKRPSISRLICFPFLWMIIPGCATNPVCRLSSRLLRASKENFPAAVLVNTAKICKWMGLESRRRRRGRRKKKENSTKRREKCKLKNLLHLSFVSSRLFFPSRRNKWK